MVQIVTSLNGDDSLCGDPGIRSDVARNASFRASVRAQAARREAALQAITTPTNALTKATWKARMLSSIVWRQMLRNRCSGTDALSKFGPHVQSIEPAFPTQQPLRLHVQRVTQLYQLGWVEWREPALPARDLCFAVAR